MHDKDKEPTCVWEREGYASLWSVDSWKTNCGNLHYFSDGGPEENEHRFCPYCGKKLEVKDALDV